MSKNEEDRNFLDFENEVKSESNFLNNYKNQKINEKKQV